MVAMKYTSDMNLAVLNTRNTYMNSFKGNNDVFRGPLCSKSLMPVIAFGLLLRTWRAQTIGKNQCWT